MQRRRGAVALAEEAGGGRGGIVLQQSPDRLDVAAVNRQAQLDRDVVVTGDALTGLLLTHRAHHARRRAVSGLDGPLARKPQNKWPSRSSSPSGQARCPVAFTIRALVSSALASPSVACSWIFTQEQGFAARTHPFRA